MRLKIYSCHHLKPEFTCNTEIFQTFVSNMPEPEDGSFISDLGGINIAGDNRYSELRHQYYVWKNLIGQYDYIGFEHYRRPFLIDTLPPEQLRARFPDVLTLRLLCAGFAQIGMRRELNIFEQYLAMRRSLDAAEIAALKQWIGGYDIVVPRPTIENIETQWKGCFEVDSLWPLIVEGVNQSEFFRDRLNFVCYQMEVCYFANMYIMRSNLLDEYLTFCFGVLEYYSARLDLRERSLGYVSERLFSFWLYQKRIECPALRVLELPFLMLHPPADANATQKVATGTDTDC